jgi:hypothetical protein
MDYLKILEIATQKVGIEFPFIINEIKARISAGSTGGEIIGMVGKYLKDMEKENPIAYSYLSGDIKPYINECRKIGIIIR